MASAMRLFLAVRRSPSTKLAVGCLAVLLLVLGAAPSWSEEGTGTPLALGYINSDGESDLVEFIVAEPVQQEAVAAGALGVPAEPQGHRLVRLTNVERAEEGLPPLKAASELMASSHYHSNWMAGHDCFAHNCPGEPTWVQRIINAGYAGYVLLGENIAAGYPTANAAVQAWMGSSGHRANLLNPYFREAGGGYAYSANSTYKRYWTMDYGARSDAQGYPVYPVVINREAWSTTSLQVQLCVYGQGWAQEMRFRNEGGTWSNWQPYSRQRAWTLSAANGSPASVYAQIKRGGTVLESSDEIHLDLQLTVTPGKMVFLWAQGSPTTTPGHYVMNIDAAAPWTATANRSWIRLSQGLGSGPATVTVYLEGFPTKEGAYEGAIVVESVGMVAEVQVKLSVTREALEEGHVPLLTKG